MVPSARQTRTSRSSPPVTISSPVGLNAAARIPRCRSDELGRVAAEAPHEDTASTGDENPMADRAERRAMTGPRTRSVRSRFEVFGSYKHRAAVPGPDEGESRVGAERRCGDGAISPEARDASATRAAPSAGRRRHAAFARGEQPRARAAGFEPGRARDPPAQSPRARPHAHDAPANGRGRAERAQRAPPRRRRRARSPTRRRRRAASAAADSLPSAHARAGAHPPGEHRLGEDVVEDLVAVGSVDRAEDPLAVQRRRAPGSSDVSGTVRVLGEVGSTRCAIFVPDGVTRWSNMLAATSCSSASSDASARSRCVAHDRLGAAERAAASRAAAPANRRRARLPEPLEHELEVRRLDAVRRAPPRRRPRRAPPRRAPARPPPARPVSSFQRATGPRIAARAAARSRWSSRSWFAKTSGSAP